MVAGRFVNAYSDRDWALGLIYRCGGRSVDSTSVGKGADCQLYNACSDQDWVLVLTAGVEAAARVLAGV